MTNQSTSCTPCVKCLKTRLDLSFLLLPFYILHFTFSFLFRQSDQVYSQQVYLTCWRCCLVEIEVVIINRRKSGKVGGGTFISWWENRQGGGRAEDLCFHGFESFTKSKMTLDIFSSIFISLIYLFYILIDSKGRHT